MIVYRQRKARRARLFGSRGWNTKRKKNNTGPTFRQNRQPFCLDKTKPRSSKQAILLHVRVYFPMRFRVWITNVRSSSSNGFRQLGPSMPVGVFQSPRVWTRENKGNEREWASVRALDKHWKQNKVPAQSNYTHAHARARTHAYIRESVLPPLVPIRVTWTE